MSTPAVALLLLVPIMFFAFIIYYSRKRRKKEFNDKISEYVRHVSHQNGIESSFQQQLIHQMIIFDNKAEKLLVIYHDDVLTHDIIDLDSVSRITVFHNKYDLPGNNGDKSDTIVTQIGLQILLAKTGEEKFLALYDHTRHNIYEREGCEKAAWQLYHRMVKLQNRKKAEV